jgi:predicted nucleic acid-binding protein
MKLRIIVDANILISALLGGKSRFILFDPKFEFITTQFTLQEVEKYISFISKKSGISESEISEAINLIPLTVISRNKYKKFIKESTKIMMDIDKNDIEILALYLKERTYLWSEDKDFDRAIKKLHINLIKTEDFFI